MYRTRPIMIIDDDQDYHYLYADVFRSIGVNSTVLSFDKGKDALKFLSEAEVLPLMIICDINMPEMNGFQVRELIHSDFSIQKKNIPFVFLSSAETSETLARAYSLSAQGFFVKKDDFEGLKAQLKVIYDYWRLCRHPPDI